MVYQTVSLSPLNDHLDGGARGLDDAADLVVRHLEDLLAVDAPDVVPLLQAGGLGRAVGLDPAQLDSESLVLSSHNDHPPGLPLLPLDGDVDHFLRHPGGFFFLAEGKPNQGLEKTRYSSFRGGIFVIVWLE